MSEQNEERYLRLARDVLTLSRNTLLVNLRFLDAALSRLTPEEKENTTYRTDGKTLFFDPMYVLRCYRVDRAVPVRDYLHVVLHCVYRHMFIHTLMDRMIWDLACDIAAEYSISTMNLNCVAAARQQQQLEVFETLKKTVGKLTAEKIYRYYLDEKLPADQFTKLARLFYVDDHSSWYEPDAEEQPQTGNKKGGKRLAGVGIIVQGNSAGGAEGFGGDAPAAMPGSEEDWRSVSERMQMDLETFSKLQGTQAGGLIQNLRAVNRERYNYADFLRRFAVRGEVMKINDDEFDYIYYTYGLSLYDNMPLVEPLEYKETKRIREFVIAIDTSGSVMGETVQRFVEKTYNILKNSESFFSKINVHIIQCDTAIQEDAKITSQEEFDNYLKTMQIHGLGGTDFRPVFGYVQYLLEKKEFTNLKGLIYFTDGYGTFPEKKPDYKTAFVFLGDEDNNYDVPPWAIKLVLGNDEI